MTPIQIFLTLFGTIIAMIDRHGGFNMIQLQERANICQDVKMIKVVFDPKLVLGGVLGLKMIPKHGMTTAPPPALVHLVVLPHLRA